MISRDMEIIFLTEICQPVQSSPPVQTKKYNFFQQDLDCTVVFSNSCINSE